MTPDDAFKALELALYCAVVGGAACYALTAETALDAAHIAAHRAELTR